MRRNKDHIKSQKGFSLLEALFSLSVFMMLFLMIPPLFSLTFNSPNVPPYEVEVFFQQLSSDVREATSLDIRNNHLVLSMLDGEEVSVERYKNLIRRQVNESGHEVMLQNIQTVSFNLMNHGVVVKIIYKDGNEYQRRLSLAPAIL